MTRFPRHGGLSPRRRRDASSSPRSARYAIGHVDTRPTPAQFCWQSAHGFQLMRNDAPRTDGRPVPDSALVDTVAPTHTEAARRPRSTVRDDADSAPAGSVGFENHRGVTAIASGAVPIGPRRPGPRLRDRRARVHRAAWSAAYLHGPVLARTRSSRTSASIGSQAACSVAGPQADLLHEERFAPRSSVHTGGRSGHGDEDEQVGRGMTSPIARCVAGARGMLGSARRVRGGTGALVLDPAGRTASSDVRVPSSKLMRRCVPMAGDPELTSVQDSSRSSPGPCAEGGGEAMRERQN